MNVIVNRVWTLARVFHRFYGYIFCKPLGDNTPPVEIVYGFNGLVNLKLPVTPTKRSIELYLIAFSFLFLLEDEQKIGMGAFDNHIFLHHFIPIYCLLSYLIN